MSKNAQVVTLESNKRFSECHLWEVQKAYYKSHGIEAWTSEIPFYITSNPFIGFCYADLVVRFWQDYSAKNPGSLKYPLTLLELGAGPGQFSFYMLKNMLALKQHFKLEHLTIRYLMSDLTTNKFKFWRTHPALAPYVRAGILDFAVFDLENDTKTTSHIHQWELAPNSLINPLIVVANYIFDSVRNDIFSMSNGEMSESLVSLKTNPQNIKDNEVLNWKKVKIEHKNQSCEMDYYQNSTFDAILKTYADKLIDSHIQYPIGALEGLERLRAMSGGKLLLLTSDKGYVSLEELDNLDYPELDFHGSFSVMVNFDAISQYCQQLKGSAYLQPQREGIATNVFSTEFTFDDFPHFMQGINERINGFTPADYFITYEEFSDHPQKYQLMLLTSQLCLSRWDPYFYSQIKDRLNRLLEKAEVELVKYLADHMGDIWSNFYYMPEGDDTAFDIGVFFHEQERYQEALDYYWRSLELFGEGFAIFYNIGFCLYYIGDKQKSLEHLEKAHAIKPKSKECIDWIHKVKRELP